MPVEVFANAPATDPTLTVPLASATATSATVTTIMGLPAADPTVFPPAQWRGSFLDSSGNVLERFVCTDNRTTTLTVIRQAEDSGPLPAGVWPSGTKVAHDLTAGAMTTVGQSLVHKWRRHGTAAQAIAATTTTTVVLDALDYDSANLDPGVANGLTIRRAGLYSVTWGAMSFGPPAGASTMYAWVIRNGATAAASRIGPCTTTTAGGGTFVLGGADTIQCAAGDTMILQVYTTVAQSIITGGGSVYLAVTRLSD